MRVHNRVVIVVRGINRSDVARSGLIEGRQVTFQNVQVIAGIGIHAVNLGTVRDRTVFTLFTNRKHGIQFFLIGIMGLGNAEPVLGHKFLYRCRASIDHTAVGDAALCVYGVDRRLRQGSICRESAAGREVTGFCYDKIADHIARDVFVHVKAAGKDHGQGEQDDSQRERGDREHGLLRWRPRFAHAICAIFAPRVRRSRVRLLLPSV